MEAVEEDVVIVGAGIAGLTTALGLHRLGIRSLVLESSESLRATGFAMTTWPNAWRALDAVGIADSLRLEHHLLQRVELTSSLPGKDKGNMFETKTIQGAMEFRCVRRKLLVEQLASALPSGTVRYSSRVVSIEESGQFKLLHLADGDVFRTKVLIGCDGVNSIVAKWLGFKEPSLFVARSTVRGFADYKGSHHGFEPTYRQFFGKGIQSALVPCDDRTVYWFSSWNNNSSQDEELEDDPVKMKQFVLSKVPEQMKAVVRDTHPDFIRASALRFRQPWEVLWGNISKGNVCIAGDALHPMTPDLGQGGCSALEEGVILARCIARALKNGEDGDEFKKIETGLKRFAKERRWRSFQLISMSYVVGFLQFRDGKILNFLRDKILSVFMGILRLKIVRFDCGSLDID